MRALVDQKFIGRTHKDAGTMNWLGHIESFRAELEELLARIIFMSDEDDTVNTHRLIEISCSLKNVVHMKLDIIHSCSSRRRTRSSL